MTLHRFFLPSNALRAEGVTFPADTSHQIGRVLRMQPGDRVVVFDGSGMECIVVLESVGRVSTGAVETRRRNESEPRVQVALYQGLLKGAKLDLVIQKCTEIGVGRIVPVVTARAVPAEPSPARQVRFETIAREAAEQSGRGRVPEIAAPMRYSEAIEEARAAGLSVFCWEEEHAVQIADLAPTGESPQVALFVGPEGGFTLEEAEQARRVGLRTVSLGRRILRAETAAIVGTVLLLAHFGEL